MPNDHNSMMKSRTTDVQHRLIKKNTVQKIRHTDQLSCQKQSDWRVKEKAGNAIHWFQLISGTLSMSIASDRGDDNGAAEFDDTKYGEIVLLGNESYYCNEIGCNCEQSKTRFQVPSSRAIFSTENSANRRKSYHWCGVDELYSRDCRFRWLYNGPFEWIFAREIHKWNKHIP